MPVLRHLNCISKRFSAVACVILFTSAATAEVVEFRIDDLTGAKLRGIAHYIGVPEEDLARAIPRKKYGDEFTARREHKALVQEAVAFADQLSEKYEYINLTTGEALPATLSRYNFDQKMFIACTVGSWIPEIDQQFGKQNFGFVQQTSVSSRGQCKYNQVPRKNGYYLMTGKVRLTFPNDAEAEWFNHLVERNGLTATIKSSWVQKTRYSIADLMAFPYEFIFSDGSGKELYHMRWDGSKGEWARERLYQKIMP